MAKPQTPKAKPATATPQGLGEAAPVNTNTPKVQDLGGGIERTDY